MVSHLYLIFIVLSFTISFQFVYAQHHGGEQAPPISFGNRQLSVTTSITPDDFIPGKDTDLNLKIRFFDFSTNVNIESVTYRVQIFFGNNLVANQMFFDKDGELDIKIQPKSQCEQQDLWKCTKYQGENDPIVPNALTSSSSRPIITGPVFSQSGEYTVKTSIIGATNPKTQTSEDIEFETSIIIPHQQEFTITESGNQYPIYIKNFHNSISNFQFDESKKSITFQIPSHGDHVGHIKSIKHYIIIPKNFSLFEDVPSIAGFVDETPIPKQNLHFDKYSNKNSNIIHLSLDDEMTSRIISISSTNFIISPDFSSSLVTKEIIFSTGFKALVSYDSIFSDKKTLFSIVFFDPQDNLAINSRYAYSLKHPNGNEILNTGSDPNLLGIKLPTGMDNQIIETPIAGKYFMEIGLIGVGSKNFERLLFESFEFNLETSESLKSQTQNSSIEIPRWIKNNAGWWASGDIDDNSFIQGIQFMIKNKILNIPISNTETSSLNNEIPQWIKNNAGWWASGQIDDESFTAGLQFLIKEGIIKV